MKPSLPVLTLIGIFAFSTAAWVSHRQMTRSWSEQANHQTALSKRAIDSSRHRFSGQSLSEVERQRAAIRQARKLSLSGLKELLRNETPGDTPGFAHSLLRTIARERWSREEPGSYLEWTIQKRRPSDDPHLARLIKDEPEVISTFLFSKKPAAQRVRLFSKVTNHDPDFALRELPGLLDTDMGRDNNLRYALYTLAKTQLAELEKLMTSNPNPELVNAVFHEKLAIDFNGAFDQLITRADGLDLLYEHHTNHSTANPQALMSRLGDLPESWRRRIALSPGGIFYAFRKRQDRLDIAWEELGFTLDQANKIRTRFLQGEAFHNPAPAFALLGEYEFTTNEKRDVFKTALRQNRTAGEWEKIRSELTDPGDELLFDEMAKTRPTLTRKKITSPDDLFAAARENESPDYLNEMQSWSQTQKQDFYNRFETADPDLKTRLSEMAARTFDSAPGEFLGPAILHLLNETELKDPEIWTARITGNNASQVAAKHAINLLESDPRKAQAWLNKLPEGTTREDATKNMALHWIGFDPGATDQWIESMPAGKQESVRQFVDTHYSR